MLYCLSFWGILTRFARLSLLVRRFSRPLCDCQKADAFDNELYDDVEIGHPKAVGGIRNTLFFTVQRQSRYRKITISHSHMSDPKALLYP